MPFWADLTVLHASYSWELKEHLYGEKLRASPFLYSLDWDQPFTNIDGSPDKTPMRRYVNVSGTHGLSARSLRISPGGYHQQAARPQSLSPCKRNSSKDEATDYQTDAPSEIQTVLNSWQRSSGYIAPSSKEGTTQAADDQLKGRTEAEKAREVAQALRQVEEALQRAQEKLEDISNLPSARPRREVIGF